MTRHTGLGLAEHLHQLADRPFALGANGEQAQPRRFGGGAQPLEQLRERAGVRRNVAFGTHGAYIHVRI